MLIALQGFRGERPARDARQLDYLEAQICEDFKVWRGVLEPWIPPLLIQAAVNSGPLKSIFRYTDVGYWMHWDADVDVVRAPIAGVDRLYWTGDGAPRMGSVDSIAGITSVAATAPGSQNFVIVDDSIAFSDGDSVTITLDSGSHTTTITTVQQSLNRLNLTVALPTQASAGNVVTKNGSGAFPYASYLLGVPAPASALTTSVNAASARNTGDVLSISAILGRIYSPLTTTAQIHSVDLTGIDGNGQPIEFAIEVGIDALLNGVQNRDVIVTVVRDPAGDAEEIYRYQFTKNVQAGEDGVTLVDHRVGRTINFQLASIQTANEYLFQFAPEAGADTYRLTVQNFFTLAGGGSFTYRLGLTARLGGGIGVQLDTSLHGAKEGDLIRLSGIRGTGSLNVLNTSSGFPILSVAGDTVYVDAPAFGDGYTSGGIWELSWEEEDREARTYVCTYVATLDSKDMEGPPSPASIILLAGDNQAVTVSGFVDPTTLGDGRPYSAIRIYRTSSGTDDAIFQFVGQVSVDATTFEDNLRGTDLDEVLPSQYLEDGELVRWEPPPTDMRGIIELPNGQLAAFRGNELLFAEPNQPHAWPPAYRHTMHDQVVGLGAFGASILVGTKGRPVIVTGTDPITVSEEHVEIAFPCESKRGIVDMGYGILYPSKRGLVMISQGQAGVVTEGLFTDNQWDDLNPSSFVAAKYGNRYVWFYDNGTEQGGFILDPKNPLATLSRISLHVTEVWSDPRTDILYLVTVNAAGNEEIVEWEGDKGGVPWRGRWRSKEFTARYPVAMSVVKVDAEHYPVTVNVYADGKLYDSVEVFDENTERLSDLLGQARKWEAEVVGNTEIEAVYIASSVMELTRYLSSVA